MRSFLPILFLLHQFIHGYAQETEPSSVIEQQIENHTEAADVEMEDDFYFQQLEYYIRHPLNLNEASAGNLREFKILSDQQIQNFILYRDLLGPLINIYELQAIPSWDIPSIRKLIPYIVVTDSKTVIENFRERLFAGSNILLLRSAMVFPKSKGFLGADSAASFYQGSRPHILVRYKYNYKNLLQYGLLGEKDAGEQFFRGIQKQGFDFYSFHFFSRKSGVVKSLAIGDFTVNLGQGLIHWQSLAFKKSVAIGSVKRQTDVLRPYSSPGEYNFHRGAGITLAKKNWETTVFLSIRKLNATVKKDSIQDRQGYISSLLNSGYHRTPGESEDRNNVQFITMGANSKYTHSKWHAGINWVQYFFSKPFKASDRPYDLFAIEGKKWSNFSFDYGYTVRNIHVFGEIAADKNFRTAVLQGMIASIDRSVDLAIVYRRIDKQYQSLYGNAFTENSSPTNENGFYTGISIRPVQGWKIDAYADFYQFPWLLYRANAPSYGKDYLLQATFVPNKQVEIYLRYKKEEKQANRSAGIATDAVLPVPKRNLRYQISYKMNREFLLKNRVELLWYEKEISKKQNGYLIFLDVHYKPYSKPYSANTRLQYFETDGYNARIYAYENDVLYSSSTPAFFEKGFRWYFNMTTNVSRWAAFKQKCEVEISVKCAITQYFGLDKIGTELNEIQGNFRSEIKFQLLLSR